MPHHDPTEFPEPTYKEASEGWQQCQIENARLQEQVKEADEVVVLAVAALKERVQEVDLLKRERDDYKALAECQKEARKQLRDQVAGDLGDYLEVIGRGVQAWNYMDMMLLPRMEGLAESLQASYEHAATLEATDLERKKALERYGTHENLCRYGLLPSGVRRHSYSLHEDERMEAAAIKECACGLRAAIEEETR